MQGILDVFTLNLHPPASSSQMTSYLFTPLIFLVLLKKINPWDPIHTARILLGTEPPTKSWSTYQ